MEVDLFKSVIAPVIGGLGIFMLGLDFMAKGIQALSVNRMRALLAKAAGTPAKGVLAGAFITGVIQSSTAMTVMVVGLVNAGVIGLRSAIGVIMGANVGTTLGNGLIALPLGTLGLMMSGIFALVYCFAKGDRLRNIALACMGFALVFYGLNLMTGGLRPLRDMPEVMAVISSLEAKSYVQVIACILIAALMTAIIHSSSATIGIVMGLSASGVLGWETAIAFCLGADLGTTVTSWMASLNLSKDAKRAAYAHMSFNLIGVLVLLPLFFPALEVLRFIMGAFGGDPGVPVVVDGVETFPLAPAAVGLFAILFNVFNLFLMFPFVGVFERVLSRVGRNDAEAEEDYSLPKFLGRALAGGFGEARPAIEQELERQRAGCASLLDVARKETVSATDIARRAAALDVLAREISAAAADLFKKAGAAAEMRQTASLQVEADFAASLTRAVQEAATEAAVLHATRDPKSRDAVKAEVDAALSRLRDQIAPESGPREGEAPGDKETGALDAIRARAAGLDWAAAPGERRALLAFLGAVERAAMTMRRIRVEQRSADRLAPAPQAAKTASGAPFGAELRPAG